LGIGSFASPSSTTGSIEARGEEEGGGSTATSSLPLPLVLLDAAFAAARAV